MNALETAPKPQAKRRFSLPLGRFLGIDVVLHGSFLLLLLLLGITQLLATGSPPATALSLMALLAIFGSVLLHEFGHALAARRYGIATKQITLLPIGGIAQLERMPEQPREQLVVAIAGPVVNLVLAASAAGLYGVTAVLGGPAALLAALSFFLTANLLIFAFNLLPALPLDGGRVLRAFLAMRTSPLRATEIAAQFGKFFALLFAVAGLFFSPFLILIALFVWFGATQEAAVARAKAGLSGAPVERAMATEFHVLAPTDRLRNAAELTVRTSQRHFPVVHAGRLVGVLYQGDLRRALAEGATSSVGRVMRPQFDAARPADQLEAVFDRLHEASGGALPVLDGSRLVGLLTLDGLRDYLTMKSAGQPA